jgi:transposase
MMTTTTFSQREQSSELGPGVYENLYGGYHIHLILDELNAPVICGPGGQGMLAPLGAPVLTGVSVFEDTVVLNVEGGQSLLLRVTDPSVAGSVLHFYHRNGRLWRVVRLEELNPGWVFGQYHFRGDLRQFDGRLARIRHRSEKPTNRQAPTFWQTGGWQKAVVHTTIAIVSRVWEWQHTPELTQPQVLLPSSVQVTALQETYPAEVQALLALQEKDVTKVTYQVGGLNLVLTYVERIGLAEAVDRRCVRDGELSEGTVITVLVVNRLLSPCALGNVAEWVKKTGLHLLLGIPDPEMLNYYRLADALLAIYPHWQDIAAEVTLKAVERFRLAVETIHYDLTSVFFQGSYKGSSWVEFGYSRDHRPDKPQVNIGLTTTADGEVVLPGGSGIHPGSTNDVTTTVATHSQLHNLFQRSDLLVTGDRVMQSAGNMLAIARGHGRFLGPVDWTPYLREVVSRCQEEKFQTLPEASRQAGHLIKATFCRLRFKVKEELSKDARQRLRERRRRQKKRGRVPSYRKTYFRVRAAIILDTARQVVDAARRSRGIQAYEAQLDWVHGHLNKGQYYGDPEWVAGHLADLAHDFKEVRGFVKVTFQVQDGVMSLDYQRRPEKIAQAARLDGKWVLVSNQPLAPGQSMVNYMDWMVRVYKNHCHVERRMRNLKSDLPIRPIYLHRDDAIVALCFVSVLALMVYSLIERDCQSNPALAEAGLRTTNQVLAALTGLCLTSFTVSGYQVFWLDNSTWAQRLIWQTLDIPDPGTRAPSLCPACLAGCEEEKSLQPPGSADTETASPISLSCPGTPFQLGVCHCQRLKPTFFAVVNVLSVMLCRKGIAPVSNNPDTDSDVSRQLRASGKYGRLLATPRDLSISVKAKRCASTSIGDLFLLKSIQ